MGVLNQQQPARVQDLMAYASLVIHAARKYKGDGGQPMTGSSGKGPQGRNIKWGDLNMPLHVGTGILQCGGEGAL